ncbi:hypothetical protein [Microbacterium sp. 5K110]|jgi:hypothetical protein|uniref:hypothetical protein n=1 Tax=unclassified Microbacterium TaxID=2609290 RepID=UPI0010FDB11A|nr:hypothetical protein [Microbacterium sp. 5K110]TLF29964.1 hypothetical protein FE256_12005 [Microbacterium sp. 5K110]
MSPEDARDQALTILNGTIEAAGGSDWTLIRQGFAAPQECRVDNQDGVSFAHGAFTTNLGADPAGDVQRVADYWTSLGIDSRIESRPVPAVFGSGGPVKAISFATAPTYAISLGGICVPGNPYDYYDQSPAATPAG